jgi:hypothetical protein
MGGFSGMGGREPLHRNSPFRINPTSAETSVSPRYTIVDQGSFRAQQVKTQTQPSDCSSRQGMHQIFLEAKEKIRKLKEESRVVMKSPKPAFLMIDNNLKNNSIKTSSISRNLGHTSQVSQASAASFRSDKLPPPPTHLDSKKPLVVNRPPPY